MLRPATPEDAATISSWLIDPQINRHLTSNLRGVGLSSPLVKIALRRQDQCWYVFAPDDHSDPAGLVALDSIDAIDGVANLWFVLGHPELARRGMTSTAIRQFCDDNPMKLAVATAWAAEPNVASQACLVRAGFRDIGRLDNAVGLPDGRCARYLYARQLGTTA